MIEIWRDIKDYEGLYQVSNLGRVRSLDHYVKCKNGVRLVKGIILNLKIERNGYVRCTLCKNGITKTFLVHRLVAMAFPDLVEWTEEAKGKPFDELQVNHKDEFEKTNNCVDNLEWCTADYNTHYGTCIERRSISISKSMTNNPKISKPVLQYTLDMVFVKEYPSSIEASRQTGVNNATICNACLNKRHYKSAGGYIWKYKN